MFSACCAAVICDVKLPCGLTSIISGVKFCWGLTFCCRGKICGLKLWELKFSWGDGFCGSKFCCRVTLWGVKTCCGVEVLGVEIWGVKTCCGVWGLEICGDKVEKVSGELCKTLSLLFFFFFIAFLISEIKI